jgi:hypothetical protein
MTMTTIWDIVFATTVIALFVALHATSELAIVEALTEGDSEASPLPQEHVTLVGSERLVDEVDGSTCLAMFVRVVALRHLDLRKAHEATAAAGVKMRLGDVDMTQANVHSMEVPAEHAWSCYVGGRLRTSGPNGDHWLDMKQVAPVCTLARGKATPLHFGHELGALDPYAQALKPFGRVKSTRLAVLPAWLAARAPREEGRRASGKISGYEVSWASLQEGMRLRLIGAVASASTATRGYRDASGFADAKWSPRHHSIALLIEVPESNRSGPNVSSAGD